MRPNSLKLLAILCWALGAVSLLTFFGARAWMNRAAEQSIRAFEAARGSPAAQAGAAAAVVTAEDRILAQAGSELRADPPDQRLWSSSRISAYEKAMDRFSGLPEGVLTIPSVHVRVPVYTGTSGANLAVGAGRIEGTSALGAGGNVGIAAHRDGHFRALKDIRIGAAVFIDTLHARYRYEVVGTAIVSPEDVEVLDPTPEPSLTLVTCYPFYFLGNAPQRFIVRARRVTLPSSG